MKLLLLTDGISPFVLGGMQRHSYYLCKFLVPLGVDVTLVHCVGHAEPLPSDEQVVNALWGQELPKNIEGFHHIALRFPSPGKLPGHYIRESRKYSSEVYQAVSSRLDEYDLVYAKGFAAWELLKRKEAGESMPPIAVKFHGYEMFQPAPSRRARLEQFLLAPPTKYNNRQADAVFSYGGKITDIILSLGIAKDRVYEIPSGIDSSMLAQEVVSGNRRRFVFLGRYERRKGVEELGIALRDLLAGNHDFHFDFIGPIPADKQIQDKRITYHGRIDDKNRINEVLRGADVLVCPSHSEGLPNVLFEAMAQGLAVIATDVGATSILVDASNGFLLPKSEPGLVCEAMEKAMALSDQEMNRLKERSLEKMKERFNWETIGREHLAAFQDLIARSAS